MKPGSYNTELVEQILDLVRRLTKDEMVLLSKELEREFRDAKLVSLLKAFKTDELSQDKIDNEVDAVRAEIYARSKAK